MNHPSHLPSAEFITLTDRYLAGALSPDELRRWEKLCAEDPVAFAYYLSLTRTEGLLPEALHRTDDSALPPPRALRFRTPLVAGLAAALAIGCGLGWALRPGAASGTAPVRAASGATVPATITASIGVRRASALGQPGDRLTSAAGSFSAGLLELTLDSGVRLLLQGPAEFAVTGPNSVRLTRGRAVADVPISARGFILESPRDRIVDHGTRFAVDIAPGGAETTLGVLSGEVQLCHGDHDLRLFTDYAVRRSGDELRSVPFDKTRFVTETPGREFPWRLDGAKLDTPHTLTFEVTNLVHGPGEYRAVVRWLLGHDGITVNAIRLRRSGDIVAASGSARSGLVERTRDNAPVLRVAPEDFRPDSRWTLEIDAYCDSTRVSPPTRAASSQGVVSFEEGLSLTATAAHFTGRWHYSHNGHAYVREFHPDGTASLLVDGKKYSDGGYAGARYTVSDGVLTLQPGHGAAAETHMLRDDHTLIFLNRPYRAARKE